MFSPSSGWRRWVGGGLVAALVSGGLVMVTGAPAFAGRPVVPGCGGAGSAPVAASVPRIVAGVGDSFSSGEGTGGYQPSTVASQLWRHVSPYAPDHLAFLYLETTNKPLVPSLQVLDGEIEPGWGIDKFALAASSGAETKHLKIDQVDPDTKQNRSSPQLANVPANANVVLFGMGGNDAHYGDILSTALAAYIAADSELFLQGLLTPPASWRTPQQMLVQQAVARETGRLDKVQEQLYAGLAATHDRAPGALIVAELYPVALKPSGNAFVPMMWGQTLDAIYPFAVALNTTIRAAVNQYNADHPNQPAVEVFDPNTAGPGGASVMAGHEVGQPNSYINPWTVNLTELMRLNKLHAFQESFHPNRAGTVALGQALARWLQAKCPGLWAKAPTFNQVVVQPQPPVTEPTFANMRDFYAADMKAFCAVNRFSSRCEPMDWSGTGGGGGAGGPAPRGDYPVPGSTIQDLWLDSWIAGASPTGSTEPGSTGTADASTPGGNNPPSTSGSGQHFYYVDARGNVLHFEYDPVTGQRKVSLIESYSDIPSGSTLIPTWVQGAIGVEVYGSFDNPYGYSPAEILWYYDLPDYPSGASGGGGGIFIGCDNVVVICNPMLALENLA
ncbi:hypothetical protein [Dactylosporangium sp. CA-092794]|uniref:hypothetical protein n=1 Tax=Dactylosporangium sp. CA-092794 TaxID=3239929 RepID=UPI003D9162EA